MKYMTAEGVKLTDPPRGERCSYVMKHPDNMSICPMDDDMMCVKHECGYYCEYEGYENPRRKKKGSGDG